MAFSLFIAVAPATGAEVAGPTVIVPPVVNSPLRKTAQTQVPPPSTSDENPDVPTTTKRAPGGRYHSYNLSQVRVANAFIVGPGSVVFFGINPYRYPAWTGRIDDHLVAGPTPYLLPTVQGPPYGPTDTNSADLSVGKPPDVSLPDFTPIADYALESGDPCASDANGDVHDLALCKSRVAGALSEVKKRISTVEGELSKASHAYRGLLSTTDDIVAQYGRIASEADFVQYRRALSQRLFNHLDVNGSRVTGDAQDTLDLASAVEEWPTQLVTTRIAQANALANYFAAQIKKQNDAAAAALQQGRSEVAATLLAKRPDDLDAARKGASDIAQRLSAFASDSVEGQRFAKQLATLRDLIKNVQAASLDRFAFRDREPCRGISGSTREKIYTVTLFENATSKVRLVCEARMVLSGGVAFSGLSQPTYEAVPDPSPIASPGAAATSTPTPTAHIRATTRSDIRPAAVLMNNVRLSEPGAESAYYATFGLGVLQQNTGELTADYLAGISFSLSKTMFATAGIQFGKTITTAPGFEEGKLVPTDTKVQTITKFAPQAFFAITFGKQ